MKGFTFIGILIFSFCHLAKGDFEERSDLSFRVRAIYRGEGVDSIGIRGNGLGLDVFESQAMTKSEEEGVWTYDVHYKSDLYGFHCMNCSASAREIPNGDDFKVTFWAKTADSEANETRMVGDVFRIPLPQSKVSTYFEEKPVFDFYPYFFSKEGNFVTLDVVSPDESIGARQIVVYLPPGFSENQRPVYDVYYVLDLSPSFVEKLREELHQVFTEGVAHDAIVIGHGDWRPDYYDRTYQLTPVESAEFDCKEGSFDDLCNYCLPPDCTYEEYIYWMTQGGCGITYMVGGNGEANVEFLLTTVYETVDEYLRLDYGSSLTKSRDGTFIIGFSHGGLLSCYASWTRPASFGGAACQSSSFEWPLTVNEDSVASVQFYFANTTLKTHLDDRLPQKMVIDAGGLEEVPVYQTISAASHVFDIVSEHPMFEANRNVWFHVYPGKAHSGEIWIQRLWNAFKMLSSGRN